MTDEEAAIGEQDMSDEDRRAALDATWRSLMDPAGRDWQTLESIEVLTAPHQPTDEERRAAIRWWRTLDLPERDATER